MIRRLETASCSSASSSLCISAFPHHGNPTPDLFLHHGYHALASFRTTTTPLSLSYPTTTTLLSHSHSYHKTYTLPSHSYPNTYTLHSHSSRSANTLHFHSSFIALSSHRPIDLPPCRPPALSPHPEAATPLERSHHPTCFTASSLIHHLDQISTPQSQPIHAKY
jgi:hypothetical protein